MPAEVRVLGADRLAATLEKASKQIADMSDGYGKAAEIVSGAGASSAPRRTGRLAGSMTTERAKGSATITSPLVYAVPIHWGRPAHNIEANPFLMRAADRTEAQWVGAIDDEVQRICNEVEGA